MRHTLQPAQSGNELLKHADPANRSRIRLPSIARTIRDRAPGCGDRTNRGQRKSEPCRLSTRRRPDRPPRPQNGSRISMSCCPQRGVCNAVSSPRPPYWIRASAIRSCAHGIVGRDVLRPDHAGHLQLAQFAVDPRTPAAPPRPDCRSAAPASPPPQAERHCLVALDLPVAGVGMLRCSTK